MKKLLASFVLALCITGVFAAWAPSASALCVRAYARVADLVLLNNVRICV